MGKVKFVKVDINDPTMQRIANGLMNAHAAMSVCSFLSFLSIIVGVIIAQQNPRATVSMQNILAAVVNLVLVLGCCYFAKYSIESNSGSNMQIICIGEGICGVFSIISGVVYVLAALAIFLLSSATSSAYNSMNSYYASNSNSGQRAQNNASGALTILGVVMIAAAVLVFCQAGICIWGCILAGNARSEILAGKSFTGAAGVPVVVGEAVAQPVAVAVVVGETKENP